MIAPGDGYKSQPVVQAAMLDAGVPAKCFNHLYLPEIFQHVMSVDVQYMSLQSAARL